MTRVFGLLIFLAGTTFSWLPSSGELWGFWGHRRINRLAVFTLPPEMMGFYKQHIEYITEHAVDPDKRRYATKHEAPRHFIDIDHWGTYPFEAVPRDWDDALIKYTSIHLVTTSGDTTEVKISNSPEYKTFFRSYVLPQYYEEEWRIDCDTLSNLLGRPLDCQAVYAVDHFSEYGIVPYHLLSMKRRLTRAFLARDEGAILRLSAEIGHYIADAHVPLHTTENYNGQLTDQLGIHAFWESRIPELFADEQYDYFVGPAEYVARPRSYFWEVVLNSHQLLDSVLWIEKDLSRVFPEDQQYCYEQRLGRTIRTQCKEYAAAYQERMNGMVEARMRAAIHAVGSIWFTSWVDAGQPNLNALADRPEDRTEQEQQRIKELNQAYQSGAIKGREHGNNR
ncbi:MAG TPA: zinc dependent phospholipase C family protein [Saprospiraceae bacterium]|nr:zinc dependent phospholipase C family protein [Saprospiraceae bacterium]